MNKEMQQVEVTSFEIKDEHFTKSYSTPSIRTMSYDQKIVSIPTIVHMPVTCQFRFATLNKKIDTIDVSHDGQGSIRYDRYDCNKSVFIVHPCIGRIINDY